MKKKIFGIICVIVICFACFCLGFWANNKFQNKQSENKVETPTGDEGLIKTPDRIIFKYRGDKRF